MTFIVDEILSEGGITGTTVSATTYQNLTSGNLPTVQARRTTGYNLTITPSFITLDATDVENQPSVIQHDNTNTERIYVYSTGLYLIHYHADVGPGTVSDFEFAVTKNLLTLLDGSYIAGKNSSTDKVTAGVNVMALLNSGDYISLVARYVASSSGIANNIVLSITKMEGVVGPQGATGPQGPAGTGLFTGGTINSPTQFTAGLTGDTINVSNQTSLRILSTDSNKNITSLDTATYPDLTELSYVKGVTSAIQTQLDGKEPTITNGYGINGTTTKSVSLTSTQVFATATTSINAATYIDITGCSVSLAAGTWLITGLVVGAATNAIVQGFVSIRDGSNNVIAAAAMSRPASGTANLNAPISISWSALVSPASTTTYKLSAARGLTTHTATWTVYDGTGYNTTNHASDNSDKGTNILAIRIA